MASEIMTCALGIHVAIAADLSVFGGILRCGSCGREEPVGDIAGHVRTGWPACCGQTMTWVTRKQQLAESRHVPPGFELAAVVAGDWRLEEGRRCSARRGRCGEPAVAAFNRRRHYPPRGLLEARTVDSWWPYCVTDMYGNWVEKGHVMHWVLREKTGA